MVRQKKSATPAEKNEEKNVTANIVDAEWKAQMEERIAKLETVVKILSEYKVSKTQIMRDESYKLLWERDLFDYEMKNAWL